MSLHRTFDMVQVRNLLEELRKEGNKMEDAGLSRDQFEKVSINYTLYQAVFRIGINV